MSIDDELAALDSQHSAIHGLLDQVDAYRAACTAREYPETTVEMLAIQYHWVLMQDLNRSLEQVREQRAKAMLLEQVIANARREAEGGR